MNYKKAFNEAAQYYFTVVLVFLNIVIFLICTFTGNLLYLAELISDDTAASLTQC